MTITVHVKSGQNKWDVTINESDSITQLKEEIAKVSEIPSENQRLIYSGKILKDDQTVESYNIKDDHSIHLVKSGGQNNNKAQTGNSVSSSTATDQSTSVPSNLSAGQTSGFNPLADMTSARYAGYLNMPSADMFGPDGGVNSGASQDDMLRMLDNPIFQSQMNEMLSNPQMIDFMIQQNPQLQAMGPQARQILQSPMFRQMLTNPDMIRQSMQFANMMGGANGAPGGAGAMGAEAFPAPGETTINADSNDTTANTNNATTGANANANSNSSASAGTGIANPAAAGANPFASLFNPAMNPFANAAAGAGSAGAGGAPAFDPSLLASMFQPAAQQQQQDNRPPEERYESQLRQLNDMGFFEFDRNVAALRRSGGSVQGALDALLNGDV